MKLVGYIKNQRVIVLINSGFTRNFIHRQVVEETQCYVFMVHIFQIMNQWLYDEIWWKE